MGDTETTDPGERRRTRRIANMRSMLRSLEWELQRIATLGNEESALAFHELSIRLLLEATQAQSLRAEFARLATREFNELEAALDAAEHGGEP